MQLSDYYLLKIYLDENDKVSHAPLYEVIIQRAHEEKMAGATVIKGVMGYGRSAHIHTSKILVLSEHLPMVIEIIDSKLAIDRFLPKLQQLVKNNFITIQKIEVLLPNDRT